MVATDREWFDGLALACRGVDDRSVGNFSRDAREISYVMVRRASISSSPPLMQAVGSHTSVRGKHQARRTLEIGSAGGHYILLIGPPGTGKTLLASRLPSILPPLEEEEALEAVTIALIEGREFNPAGSSSA